ncbi:MAG: Recombinase [Pseudomonadota bacterium]|jgi:hypothetical protein
MPPVTALQTRPEALPLDERRRQLAVLRDELARRRLDTGAVDQVPRLATGMGEVDRLLGGGWPKGGVSALTAPEGAGATSLLVRSLGRVTRSGALGAWVLPDVPGAGLSAPALAEAGVDLGRLLMVRTPSREALWAAQLLARTGALGLVVVEVSEEARSAEADSAMRRLVDAARAADTAVVVLSRGAYPAGATLRARLERPALLPAEAVQGVRRPVRLEVRHPSWGERAGLVVLERPRPPPPPLWQPDPKRQELLARRRPATSAGALPLWDLMATRQRQARRGGRS